MQTKYQEEDKQLADFQDGEYFEEHDDEWGEDGDGNLDDDLYAEPP